MTTGSALPTLPQSVPRGRSISWLHWFASATACQVACPLYGSDWDTSPATGDFYFQAFNGSVFLPVAGYNYNSDWTPCMGPFLSRSFGRAAHPLSFVGFFVRSGSPFLRPDPRFAHVDAQELSRLAVAPTLQHSALSRPYLDGFEHDGTFGAVGMTIRGEPAFGRGSIAPQPCIRWVQGPEP